MSTLWVVTAASLLATWLNIKRLRICFAIWAVTNAIWCSVDWLAGLPEQSFLHAIYCALALYGFNSWTGPPPPHALEPSP